MRKTLIIIQLVAFAIIGSNFVNAQDEYVALDWGDAVSADYFLLGDTAGAALTYDNSVVVVGYFSDGFNINENTTNKQAIFDNFNEVATSQISEFLAGYFSASNSINTTSDPDFVGKTLYYWVLEGVTTYDVNSILAVTKYAILSDSSWGVVPSGSTPPGTSYDIRTVGFSEVVYGGVVTGGGGGTANMYTTQLVPEPAFYAAGLGVIALLVVQLHRRRKVA